jgi:hypothetical protein
MSNHGLISLIDSSRKLFLICTDIHVINLYLVLYACTATFDVMCVKKHRDNQTGLSLRIKYVAFSYRWPLVSFVSKPVAVRTTVHPVVYF